MFSYRPHFIPSSVVLIGAGGTGSRLMPALSQLVRTCISKFNPQAWLLQLPIYVIDGDIVEEKNLLRQNFIHKDVGQNKAIVVANRYSNAFQIPIHASTAFLRKETTSLTFPGETSPFSFNNSIVILAVDSATARRDILQFIFENRKYGLNAHAIENRNLFVIDAGNEDAFGQVKFFTNSALHVGTQSSNSNYRKTFPKSTPVSKEIAYIPMDIDYYRTLGGSAAELSCVDLPQTLAINNMMAALICSVVQNFLYMKPMNFDGIRFGLDGSMTTELNTPRRWLGRRTLIDRSNSFETAIRTTLTFRNPEQPESEFETLLVESIKVFTAAGLVVDEDGELQPAPVKVKVAELPEAPAVALAPLPVSEPVHPREESPAAEMPPLIRIEGAGFTHMIVDEVDNGAILPPLPAPVRRRRPAPTLTPF